MKKRHFYLRDHLGNNRVVADIDGNVEEVNHYYPYGALMDIGAEIYWQKATFL